MFEAQGGKVKSAQIVTERIGGGACLPCARQSKGVQSPHPARCGKRPSSSRGLWVVIIREGG